MKIDAASSAGGVVVQLAGVPGQDIVLRIAGAVDVDVERTGGS
jgi:hypothetical protein